jgi:thioredoxin 1
LPVVEDIAREFAGRARVVKVQVDREGEVLERFRASGLPAYLVYREGSEVDRLALSSVGWFLKARVRRLLNASLE